MWAYLKERLWGEERKESGHHLHTVTQNNSTPLVNVKVETDGKGIAVNEGVDCWQLTLLAWSCWTTQSHSCIAVVTVEE